MPQPVAEVFADVPIEVITSTEHARETLTKLREADRLAADTETARDLVPEDEISKHLRVITIAARKGDYVKGFLIDARDVDVAALSEEFSHLVFDGWNADFDEEVFGRAGIRAGNWFDGMIADALLHQGQAGFYWYHGLAWATESYLDVELEGKGGVQLSYDSTSDLTEDQVEYAVFDAVATLFVCDRVRQRIHDVDAAYPKSDLSLITEKELYARPFINNIQLHGLPFAWEEWQLELEGREQAKRHLLRKLAELTGGGQLGLFAHDGGMLDGDVVEEPAWNPNSDKDLKQVLNEHARDAVFDYTAEAFGERRPLGNADSVAKNVLKQIDHPICTKILALRKHEKVLSTYGDNLYKYVEGGRIRSRYKQALVGTGRLGSFAPNAQNFSPLLKPYFRPHDPDRVFVYGDLSQAELRYLAQESGDVNLLSAFREGVDVHVRTAELMFEIDLSDMKDSDPKEFKIMRQKGKTLNFAVVYGLGPRALAEQLSLGGVETSVDEAKQLLAAYAKAYPQVDEWVKRRDDLVHEFARNHPTPDWDKTFRLYELRLEADPVFRSLKKQYKKANKGPVTMLDLAHEIHDLDTVRRDLSDSLGYDPNEQEIEAEYERLAREYAWAFRYEDAVVLLPDGSPMTMPSFTPAGRRRNFNIELEGSGGGKSRWKGLFVSAMLKACGSTKQQAMQIRDEFALEHHLTLSNPDGSPLTREELVKQFEERGLKYEFIKFVRSKMPDNFEWLLNWALKKQIRRLGNAFRNAPIQGGVADVALEAFARWQWVLNQYAAAYPVQTVHDSMMAECQQEHAYEIARGLKWAFESAMEEFCPAVPAVADVDIRTSADDDDAGDELDDIDVSDLQAGWEAHVASRPSLKVAPDGTSPSDDEQSDNEQSDETREPVPA